MYTNLVNILIVAGLIAVLALLYLLVRALRQRVWIFASTDAAKKTKPIKMAYLHYENGERNAAKVSIAGSGGMPAIGHVDLGVNGDEAKVFLLATGLLEDSGETQYIEYGYIDTDGLIYRKGEKNPIGYTARPSKPNVATIKGERKWTELWLFSHLNSYIGAPRGEEKKAKAKSDSENKKRRHAQMPEPLLVGQAKMTGLRLNDRGFITSEAKAASYSLFYSLHPRQDCQEYFNGNAYGWKDTALIASLVYTVLFLLVFLYHFYIDRLPLMRVSSFSLINTAISSLVLILSYFIVWIIVRAVKNEYIERSNSIQSQIDLFNKTLSLNRLDFFICLLSLAAAILTFVYYRTNFLPLALVMLLGVLINRSVYGSQIPWKIRTSFRDEESDDDTDKDQLVNPGSDDENAIVVDYSWELGSMTNVKLEGRLQLYFPNRYIDDLRRCNPFYMQRTEGREQTLVMSMFNTMTNHPDLMARLKYIAQYIKNKAKASNLEIYDELQFALDFVQEPNITFRLDNLSPSINNLDRYIRFPDETLYDKEGDCDCKAFLASMLFYVMGYEVLYLSSRNYQHAAVGVRVPDRLRQFYSDETVLAEKCIDYEGKQYIICETTGDEFKIGEFMKPMNMDDFEEKFTFAKKAKRKETSSSRIYNWELDKSLGKELSGNLVLEFDEREMQTLRAANPFDRYGEDGRTYEENVRSMFEYLTDRDNSMRLNKLGIIADYIEESCESASLDKYETLQFALDFVQEPNIKYRVDADSAGINYANEYMRFPDETLYDKEGDCDCKSFLASMLFFVMGYKVIFLLSSKLQHAAIGVECDTSLLEKIPEENRRNTVREYNGVQYVFCETTADGHRIGISQETDINDFETIVELSK